MTIWVRVLPKYDAVEDVHNVKWRWVEPHVASREVSATILRVCADEVRARRREIPETTLAPYELREETKHCLDVGGMCRTDRKLYTVSVDGLELTVPATDVGIYHSQTRRLPTAKGVRFEHFGVVMYRLHVFPVSLFLQATQFLALHAELGKIVSEAAAIAEIERASIRASIRTMGNLS